MNRDPFAAINRRRRLKARAWRSAAALRGVFGPGRPVPRRSGPPNLLLLAVDTLRMDHTGPGGYARPTTPRIDRLAAGGLVCGNVQSPAPWTLPSFASALTGAMPTLHGAGMRGGMRNMAETPPRPLDPAAVPVPRILADHGYRTAAFYSNPFFRFGIAESFREHRYLNIQADDLAFFALDWIRRRGDRPFCCMVLFNDPHEPTVPPPAAFSRFLADTREAEDFDAARLRGLARWGDPAARVADLGRPGDRDPDLTRASLAAKTALYDGAIAHVDAAIGRIWDRLAAWGLDDNTVACVFSDHGEEFHDHLADAVDRDHDPRQVRGIGHGHTLFQELLHVPLTAWGPGIPPGRRLDEPVSLCDLAPSCLEWLGLPPAPVPETSFAPLIGRPLPAADASTDGPARILVSEDIAYGPDLVCVREGNMKLIARRGGEPLALYDLAADPAEKRDLQDAEPETTARLREALAAWRKAAAAGGGGGDWQDVNDRVRRQLEELGYA